MPIRLRNPAQENFLNALRQRFRRKISDALLQKEPLGSGFGSKKRFREFKPAMDALAAKHLNPNDKVFNKFLDLHLKQLYVKGLIGPSVKEDIMKQIISVAAGEVKAEYDLLKNELKQSSSNLRSSATKFNVFEINEMIKKAKAYDSKISRTLLSAVLSGTYPDIESAIIKHKTIMHETNKAIENDVTLKEVAGTIAGYAYQHNNPVLNEVKRYSTILKKSKRYFELLKIRHPNEEIIDISATIAHQAYGHHNSVPNEVKRYNAILEKAQELAPEDVARTIANQVYIRNKSVPDEVTRYKNILKKAQKLAPEDVVGTIAIYAYLRNKPVPGEVTRYNAILDEVIKYNANSKEQKLPQKTVLGIALDIFKAKFKTIQDAIKSRK